MSDKQHYPMNSTIPELPKEQLLRPVKMQRCDLTKLRKCDFPPLLCASIRKRKSEPKSFRATINCVTFEVMDRDSKQSDFVKTVDDEGKYAPGSRSPAKVLVNLFVDKERSKEHAQTICNPCSLLLASDLQTVSQFASHISSKNMPGMEPIMLLPVSDTNELKEHHSCMDQDNSGSYFDVATSKELKHINHVKRAMEAIFHRQLQLPVVGEQAPKHLEKDEEYEDGVTVYTEIRKSMENSLDPRRGGSVSAAIAFLAVLHIASDQNLHLIPQEGRKDFQIRQIRE